jgi:hypothetical protein
MIREYLRAVRILLMAMTRVPVIAMTSAVTVLMLPLVLGLSLSLGLLLATLRLLYLTVGIIAARIAVEMASTIAVAESPVMQLLGNLLELFFNSV